MAFAKAREVLGAVAAGESPDGAAQEMAAAVLGQEEVRLALAVAAGGEHHWRRVIELAGALLAIEREGGCWKGTGGVNVAALPSRTRA